MITSKMITRSMEIAFQAAEIKSRAEKMDSMLRGEVPEKMKRDWEIEKDRLSYRVNKQKEALDKEKADFDLQKLALEKERAEFASLKAAKDELTQKVSELEDKLKKEKEKHIATREKLYSKECFLQVAEAEAAEAKKQLDQLPQKMEDAKNLGIRKFLKSSAFDLAALTKVSHIFQKTLFDVLTAVGNHFPFKPEEYHIFAPASSDPPTMDGYLWKEEEDELLSPEGGLAPVPKVCPPPAELALLRPRYPWPADTWPEDMLPPDEGTPEHLDEEFDTDQFFVKNTPKKAGEGGTEGGDIAGGGENPEEGGDGIGGEQN